MTNNMVTAEIQIAVLGENNDSLSGYISSAVKALEKMNIQYQVTPMGTAIQADSVDKILDACKTAHQTILDLGVKRVLTNITIDHRIKGSKEMDDKVRSVISKL